MTDPVVGPEGRREPASATERLPGLDGVRGLAALFVVLHHCWLQAFPAFPSAGAPLWTAWLAFGHLAVVVFIVLSGYSLAVGPARRGWQLSGLRRFLQRRAWRILPPYWAALAFSLIVAWTIVPQPGAGPPTARSVVVYGLLLQDLIGSPTPNGAFWSIAIEAQLYFVLPLLLLVRRSLGPVAVLALVAVPAVAVELLAPHSAFAALFLRFVPQMAVLFTLGVVAAHAVGSGRARAMGLPWTPIVVMAAVPAIVVIALHDTAWTVDHFFWVDLMVGVPVALLLAALSAGRPRPVLAVLDTRPLRRLGSFSYSLYLVHAPIVMAIQFLVVGGRVPPGVPTLLVLTGVAVPFSLAFGWAFATVFEIPFQRFRSGRELRSALRVPGRASGRHAEVRAVS